MSPTEYGPTGGAGDDRGTGEGSGDRAAGDAGADDPVLGEAGSDTETVEGVGIDDPGIEGRNVLVTGGAGFVGSRLAGALAGDNRVTVLDDLSSGSGGNVPDAAELVVGDVRDPDLLSATTEGVDVVFHQAAQVSVPRSVEEPSRTHAVNATGTLRVLEAARDAEARVVMASSAAVYGRPERTPIPEDHRTAPASPYGASKAVADRYARLYASLYDLPTVVLRYFNVYGPGQSAGDGVVATFVDRALSGEPIRVHGDGGQSRDFVHVDDVVRANLAAATTDRVGRAFNVGTGTAVTVRELAETIVGLTDSDSAVVHADPREGDVRHSLADVGAARNALGYEPTVGLAEGLDSLVERRGGE